MTLKYAIIGCGRISQNHIYAAKANNLNIVGICDLVEEKMKKIISRFELYDTETFVDYQIMLDKLKPDLVAICTESGKHGEIALICLDYNCHLIIEKPITLSLSEVDQIIVKAKDKNLKVSACHQNRFNKSIQKTREAIEMGRFGRLFHAAANIRWNRGEDYYLQAPWRGTWAMDGGTLMNQCIHNIDLLRWMMGNDIIEVFAYTDKLNHKITETEDIGVALVKFSNGGYGIIEGTVNIFPKNLEETLYIFGSKGTVKNGGKSVNIIEEWLFEDKIDASEEIKREFSEMTDNVYGFGHTPLYKDVIESILTNRDPYITAEDGRRALELVLAIYYSSLTGKSVKFPLNHGNSLDFVGRFTDE